jgi:hypothetical protein
MGELPRSRPRNVPLGAPVVSRLVDYSRGCVRRLSVRETTGAAGASFQVFDGSGIGGQLIDTVSLLAGQSTRDYYRCGEYPYETGLYINVVSGTFEGVVVLRAHHGASECPEPVLIVASEVDVLALALGP